MLQVHEHPLDVALHRAGRLAQDAQVLQVGRSRRTVLAQPVIGAPEHEAREQIRSEAVLRERPRLAEQPLDDIAVVDRVRQIRTVSPINRLGTE